MNRFVAAFSTLFLTLLTTSVAFAAEGGMEAAASGRGAIAIGAGLAIGLAAIGGALGQGRAASAALEGISRNPGASDKVFTPMLLALAFMESLVIFAFLVAFVALAGKI
jgi:F-type H+-transporting ATPase subunit c